VRVNLTSIRSIWEAPGHMRPAFLIAAISAHRDGQSRRRPLAMNSEPTDEEVGEVTPDSDIDDNWDCTVVVPQLQLQDRAAWIRKLISPRRRIGCPGHR
jgi:hypothetical protein